jgi:4'-phosphopantetheinyl transferase
VDVQRVPVAAHASRVCARFFPPGDVAYVTADGSGAGLAERFTELWTRKEACVKAAGGRMADGLGMPVHGSAPLVVGYGGAGNEGAPAAERRYRVTDLAAPRGYRAALALRGEGGFQVRWSWWYGGQG